MCSSRCERPACASFSVREPVPIQKPSATERTAGTRSVTTRTPPGSSVMTCALSTVGRELLAVAVTRATRAARAAVSPAALARTARAAVSATTTAAAAAGSGERREFLDRLAGDLGIVAEAHPDATAFAVDLDHPHGDLVALAQHLFDRVDPVAGRDVRDVQ